MTKRRFLQIVISIGLLAFFGLLLAIFLITRWYNSNLQPIDIQQTSKQRFEIARGASLDEIAINLEKEGLIRDAAAFKWHLKINGQAHSLQAGVFELSPSNYASETASVLSSALQADVHVTILPAQHLKEIEASLVEQGFTSLDVQKALQADNYNNHRLMRFINQGEEGTLEGYLAPESFAIDQFNAAAAERLVRQTLDVFADYLTEEIQEAITSHEELNTVHQGIILASILEKEVPPEDRAQAAQVFLKRLRLGMKLESDATFVYAAETEGGSISVNNPSRYNTRVHFGLPPGPISNVSRSSLQAVAFPAEGEYLYFLSGDDGRTYFNETYEEHLEDIEKHCIIGCQTPAADR